MDGAGASDEALLTHAALRLSRLLTELEAQRTSLSEATAPGRAPADWEAGIILLADTEAAAREVLSLVKVPQDAPADDPAKDD